MQPASNPQAQILLEGLSRLNRTAEVEASQAAATERSAGILTAFFYGNGI